MSKFIASVKAQLTHESYRAPRVPLLVVDSGIHQPSSFDPLVSYRVLVTYGREGHCLPRDLPKIKEAVVLGLREEIYGEFRRKAIAVQQALYEQDFETAEQGMRELIAEMWGTTCAS